MRKLFAIIVSFYLVIAPVKVAHASDVSLAAPILGIANGIMGGAIISKCKLSTTQPSMLVYLAGGLAFIASEMIAANRKSQDIDNMSKKLDDLKSSKVEGGEYQKEAIQAQIDNEKSNLEFVEKRRNWMLAIKVIYTVAMAIAIAEMFLQIPPASKPDVAACSSDPSHKPIANLFALAYSSLASTNSIGGMASGIAIGTAVKVLLPKVKIATDTADKGVPILNNSYGRIGFFGATAALAFIIDGELAKQERDFKSNIDKIEKVKETLVNDDNKGLEVDKPFAKGDTTKDPSLSTYAVKALAKGTELTKRCISASKSGAANDFSSDACKNPMKLVRPKFDGGFDVPTLKMAANSGIDFAQAIANGDLGRADVEAGNLASMAGRIDKIKDDLLKKANEKLKSQGKKPIDVNGEVNRQVAALNGALMKANLGPAQLLQMPSGEAAVSASSTPPSPEVATTVPGPAAVPVSESSTENSVSEISEPEVIAEPPGSMEEKLSNLEVDEKDISQESDVSIFKQVSNRYFLNYTKIFEKKTINNPPLESETKK